MMTSTLDASEIVTFEDLHGRYRNALTAFFRRRCNNPAEAEDLTQEVFLRVIKRDASSVVGQIDSYIFQIAANLLKDEARRGAVRRTKLHVEYPTNDRDFVNDRSMIDTLDPHRIAEAREILLHSLAALSELGERTHDIFVLSRVEKFKHKEIADMLGISVSAVEKHLLKALVHLARFKRSFQV